jgi:hypothetical protein
MKKISFILICSIFVLVPFLGDALAQKKPVDIEKRVDIKEHILYTNPSCEKVVSVKNDGSMPKDSLTQRYQITCETKGQRGEATIEVKVSTGGRITGAKVVRTAKAMGQGGVSIAAKPTCKQGKTLRCAAFCVHPAHGPIYCYEVCWCD